MQCIRKERDLNPRYPFKKVCVLSRDVLSAAQPSFHWEIQDKVENHFEQLLLYKLANDAVVSLSMTRNGKVHPHSKESEMMVLGCMLTNINSLNVGADMLDEKDFYFPHHQEIFQSLKLLYKQDKPADIHLTAEELKRRGKLETVGGAGYLATLSQYAGTSAYIEEYAELVKAKSILRRMITASQNIEKEALSDPHDVHACLDQAQKHFFEISQSANPAAGILIGDLLNGLHTSSKLPFIKELQERQEKRISQPSGNALITGIPTHFVDLDKMINGLHHSNLMILAARPAMGKTALAINIASNICFHSKKAVGIFSLEMTAEQLLHRMVCCYAEVESERITKGTLSGAEFQSIVAAVGEMQKHTMLIDDQPGLKITDLRARARRMKESHNIELLVIDYLQLIAGSGAAKTMESRQNEISEISRMLKTLARELGIPILCLSQLSRKVEDRTGHRPQMSDLRESGSIEQDSDLVFFLLRRDYYDANDKPGMAELIVAKNRHGAIGSVHLTFVKELAQFRNYTPIQVQTEDHIFI